MLKSILILLITYVSIAQSDIQSARTSVVKIETIHHTNNEKLIGTATGWCWNKSTYIVTALHAVVGMEQIKVFRNKNESDYAIATIVKVIKEADLALLSLNKDLGLKPLDLVKVDPNSRDTFSVWGFPHSIYSISGDEIKFSRSLDASPTLSDLLTGNALKMKLSQQGYPLPSTSIFRISSTIQPGHSGAPIFDKHGKVLGIADGGLRGGTARLNWAIPAKTYVNNLLYSRDPIPQIKSIQSNLYSNYTRIPLNTSIKEEKAIVKSSDIKVKGVKGSITKTWTASYADIFENLDEDMQESLLESEADFGKEYFQKMSFDIYEDFKTGATFAVPAGIELEFDEGMYTVTMDDIAFMFIPTEAGSYMEIKNNINIFANEMMKQFPNASPIEDLEDEIEDDLEDEDYSQANIRQVTIDGTNAMLAAGGEAQGNIGAFMALVTECMPQEMNESQQYAFMYLMTSIEIISFTKN